MMRPTIGRTGLTCAMALAATLVVAATSLNGCATERHHRHLAVPSRVVDTQAFDRFLPPTLTYASPVQQAQVASSVVTSPGYVQVPGGPPPASPPPLPVVRVDPKPATPFANGQEPPIRIGRTGRAAPPASQRGREPLSYARIDSRGNLIDGQGRVLYSAGVNSRPVDTAPPEQRPEVIYDTAHASPRQLVARSTQVPRVASPVDAGQDGNNPGIQPLAQPRIKQFQINNYDLPDDRDYNVRVDTYEQPRAPIAAVPTYPAPAPGIQPLTAPAYVEPAASVDHGTYAAPLAPVEVAAAPVASTPVRAPGGHQTVKQVTYKGAKERRVQRLYKRGMKDLKKKHYRLATSVFKKLLKRYPNHDLSDNALYWMAEGAYAQGDWLQAMTWFQDVILRFPEGNKLPDAMLKSALCYAKLGDPSYAVQMLTEVETLFGELPVAKVARERRMALSGGF